MWSYVRLYDRYTFKQKLLLKLNWSLQSGEILKKSARPFELKIVSKKMPGFQVKQF